MYLHHCFLAPRGYLCSTSLTNLNSKTLGKDLLSTNAHRKPTPNLFHELMTIANYTMMERHISSSVNTVTIGTESLSTNAKSCCHEMCSVNQPLNWFYELMTIANFSIMERHISSIGNTMTSGTDLLSTNAKLGESMPNHAIHGYKCVKRAAMHT